MSEDIGDHLNNLVEAVKKELYAKDDEYVTVIITVLIGEEEEVVEAEEAIYRNIDSDDLPCKSARILLGDWKGREKND